MATETIIFRGKCKWAKVRAPDVAYGETEPNQYSIDVYLDKDSWKKFAASGLTLKKRTDDDGDYVQFKRKHTEDSGDVNGKPRVYLLDKQTGKYNVWSDGLIGNGSTVSVAVDVWQGKFVGHRLIRVFVEDLVEYEGGGRGKEAAAPETADLPF